MLVIDKGFDDWRDLIDDVVRLKVFHEHLEIFSRDVFHFGLAVDHELGVVRQDEFFRIFGTSGLANLPRVKIKQTSEVCRFSKTYISYLNYDSVPDSPRRILEQRLQDWPYQTCESFVVIDLEHD